MSVQRIPTMTVPRSITLEDANGRGFEVRAFGDQVAIGIHLGLRDHVYAVLDQAGAAQLREWLDQYLEVTA